MWAQLFGAYCFLKVTQKLVKQHTKAFLQDSFSPETFKGVSDDSSETHKRSFITPQRFFSDISKARIIGWVLSHEILLLAS